MTRYYFFPSLIEHVQELNVSYNSTPTLTQKNDKSYGHEYKRIIWKYKKENDFDKHVVYDGMWPREKGWPISTFNLFNLDTKMIEIDDNKNIHSFPVLKRPVSAL